MIVDPCVELNSAIDAVDVPILPIAYTLLPLRGPPSIGLVSALILAPVFVIVIFVELELSIDIPVPPVNVFCINSVPVVLPIRSPLGVRDVGVSLNAVKLIVPPCPNTAYSSVKFSFAFLNASRILSPVPSLPSTPK